VTGTPWLKRMLLLYDLPEDCPRIRRSATLPWRRVQYEPVVCLTVGKLFLRPQGLLFFTALYTDPHGRRLENLQDVRLEIAPSEVVSVEPFEPPAAAADYHPVPWIRLRTEHSGLAGDFLLCIRRFVLSSRGVHEENAELLRTLSQLG